MTILKMYFEEENENEFLKMNFLIAQLLKKCFFKKAILKIYYENVFFKRAILKSLFLKKSLF